MTAATVAPAELVAACLTGAVRRLLGGAHSVTAARVVVARVDPQWVRVRFSASPGRLPLPWEPDEDEGWMRAPTGSEPTLRDSTADPVLVVVGVGEREVLAINMLAVDEIGLCCQGRTELIDSWQLQVQVQGGDGDEKLLAGVHLSTSPDATVVVADPLVDGFESGWVDVLAAGTSWPVRPLRVPVLAARESEPATTAAPLASGREIEINEEQPESDSVDDSDQSAVPEEESAGDLELPAQAVEDGGAQMTVFGRFEVTGADGVALQPMQQQIVGAIAVCQPIPTAKLCQLIYGVERYKGFHVALNKIRRRGLAPVVTDEGYRIDIDGQWSRFTALTGTDPAAADTEQLSQAAELVTGPLFGGDEQPGWALQANMSDRVAAVFRELAARHVEDPARAMDYARRGLAVKPGHQQLGEIVSTLGGAGWEHNSDNDPGSGV
ncbi:hypothetical protein [Mycobacteroides abscessus]|uniref:hypothetical protein n=1 Tax=Mycobacteroides abscessus TaxID=36809 RepID=UPI000926B63D|nr:hypothetical protein [Mycobacteroides abscessus]SII84737.1 Uncharacterised protein [Mycobacteroides abscessus subsp. abscessus]SIK56225.1 Uncharacterised protein [Mycobacteroides abscessus subsp. abscessus]SIL84960.1 Uncharacterised protein [Mycobacteroides abscessus subsp. abscessus]SIM11331.1 Uncharacterised protein [Mycobacteroides abscessus subsp. abscessus]SIM32494.1 Uncharacterised protein [Mycobacteroides abscessus subsp. abscessus]